MKIIDFHTHAFPDAIAERAIKAIQAGCPSVPAQLDGRLSSLQASMKKNGIEKSVVCNIATKPSQFLPVLNWCKQIRSDKFEPLPSVHPLDPLCLDQISEIKANGFKGLKMHPYYQDFSLDDPQLMKIYERTASENLFLVMHTGFDIAFERVRRADPEKIAMIAKTFPQLKFVATHLGSWEDWPEVEKHLMGKDIYIETSLACAFVDLQLAKKLLVNHPQDYLLFGTDSPWDDQGRAIADMKKFQLGTDKEQHLFYLNAIKLLG
jgi:predicted TIM-barrel fold metal-dependent hydrolase